MRLLSKIIKAGRLHQTETCRVEPPEPRLFFIQESEGETEETKDELVAEENVDPEVCAELIIADAKQKAEALLEQAKAEVEELKSAAQQEGYQAGYGFGLEAAKKENSQEKEEILKLRQEAEQGYRQRIWESEGEILKLACEIAEYIIRTSISSQHDSWLVMVREAIAKIAGANELLIKVSPQDEALLVENLSSIREQLIESGPIRVEADPSLKPGDLWIETNIGQVDARISQQISTVLQELRAGMRHE
jgi:flagellar assembly protein FliH